MAHFIDTKRISDHCLMPPSQIGNTSGLGGSSSTTLKPSFPSQTTIKRRTLEDDDHDEAFFDDTMNKRGCATTNKMVACPIAKFGCISELPYDNLLEHYSSKIHQEILLKTVENYVRNLHSKVGLNGDPENLDREEYAELLDSLNILAEGLSCLHEDNVELHKNFVQLLSNITEIQKQMEQIKQSSNISAQTLHAVQTNHDILQTDIDAMKRTILESSNSSSNDGTYIWRITGVAEKIANAMSDRQTSIYSPPFFSSPTGYKTCMRLYLNGDGGARRTHLSLFFVLMRGDYDPILLWPFQYKITFCLYDQTGSRNHMIDSFRPDIKSNSFQRPRSDMNIASGIPKFVPLSVIQQENNPYIRDDCMFIRCIIDFASIPKQCISYVVNLNPGLPLSVQQAEIQAEIKRYELTTATGSGSPESSGNADDSNLKLK